MKEAVYVTMRAKPRKFDALVELLETMLVKTRGFDGCIAACLGRRPERQEVIVWHIWETLEAHEAYLEARAASGAFEALNELILEEQDYRTYAVETFWQRDLT